MRRVGRSFSVVKLLAGSCRLLANAFKPPEIRRGPDQHQAGIASFGETKETDPSGIDHRSVRPVAQPEFEQTNHIHRTRRVDGQVVALRGVVAVVAGMVDGGDDKAGIGQRLCGVMMCAEPGASAVRENNQRQFCPCDGTILYAHQAEIGGHRERAERHNFWLCGAWIPDRACQAGIGIEKLNPCGVGGRGQTTQGQGISTNLFQYQISPQCSQWN